MAELNIPTEVKDIKAFPQLNKVDRQIVAYAVLFQADNQTAFMRFHSEFVTENGRLMEAGKTASRQFWGYGKIKDYRQQYEDELAEFLGRKQTIRNESNEPTDKRRDKALDKLVSDCLDAIDSNSSLDPEILKDFVAMAKALGVLKEETERIEPARRYLPARCHTECSYRLFVESHIESGDIISECDYCRTRKFAEENGWRFDPTKNLDLPTGYRVD